MEQITEFFVKLLNTADFPARWTCGLWSDFHGWLYIYSDVMIWLAYFIIPVILIWVVQKVPSMPFIPFFWLFGAFIVLCGTTHIIDAAIFWWPAYRLSALVRFLTAVVSMLTVFYLIRDLPKVIELAITGTGQSEKIQKYEEEISRLKNEIQRLKSREV